MEISNTKISPNFGVKIKTASVLEATTRKIIYNTGVDGFKEICFAFGKTNFPGHLGYAKQAQPFVKKILDKYPNIAQAAEQINKIIKDNPEITKSELAKQVQPIIDKLGETIDITI